MTSTSDVSSPHTNNGNAMKESLQTSAHFSITTLHFNNTTDTLPATTSSIEESTVSAKKSTVPSGPLSAPVGSTTMNNTNTMAPSAPPSALTRSTAQNSTNTTTSISQKSAPIKSTLTNTNNSTTTLPQPSASIISSTMNNPPPPQAPFMTFIALGQLQILLELRLMIYPYTISMTISGLPPAILIALSGTSDHLLLQFEYRHHTPRHPGHASGKTLMKPNLFRAHLIGLSNKLHTISFTTSTLVPTSDTMGDMNEMPQRTSLWMIASRQAERKLRVKFLAPYWDAQMIEQRAGTVSEGLARGVKPWSTPRRELVGESGEVHDGVVYVWVLL